MRLKAYLISHPDIYYLTMISYLQSSKLKRLGGIFNAVCFFYKNIFNKNIEAHKFLPKKLYIKTGRNWDFDWKQYSFCVQNCCIKYSNMFRISAVKFILYLNVETSQNKNSPNRIFDANNVSHIMISFPVLLLQNHFRTWNRNAQLAIN